MYLYVPTDSLDHHGSILDSLSQFIVEQVPGERGRLLCTGYERNVSPKTDHDYS